MRTIFAIAATAEKLRTLLASLELNGVPLQNITVVMPGDETAMVPADAAGAKAVADDFSGDQKRAMVGGAIGALVGMGALALSLLPGLMAIGAGVAATGAMVSGGAGWTLGALLGLGLRDEKVAHYENRLKEGARLVAAKVPAAQTEEFVGLFEREAMEDIAVSADSVDALAGR